MIRTRGELREYLAADLAAQKAPRWRWSYRITWRVLHFQRLLRYTEFWQTQPGPAARLVAKVLRLRTQLLGEKLGFTVPPGVFGPGLSIAHAGTIVVNPSAKIGRNCRIHPGTTIGEGPGGAPIIGDDVWLGAAVQIIGPVSVGDGVAVAAGAVVLRDVPPAVTVAGVPARVVGDTGSADLLRRWAAAVPTTSRAV